MLPISSKSSLFRGVALFVLAGVSIEVPVTAHAQTGGSTNAGLEQIVVTAQRRKENLQEVPISVTAINANTLAKSGINGTLTLNQITPSVQITRSGPSTIFFIRGVGNTSGGIGEEGANAFYVDGVYLGDLAQANTEFNNIERVEVLKGPQGTLFGRNSSGGLVNIITREPGDKFVASVTAGYGNYNTYKGQLYVAGPISDKLSVDIALTGRDQNKGWGKNFFNGEDYGLGWGFGARSKIVWRPGDATKVILSGDYKKTKDTFTSGFNLFKGTVGLGGVTYLGDYNISTPTAGSANIRVWGSSLTVEHEFDWATVTSITAYRFARVKSGLDADYLPAPITFADVQSKAQTYQQELRLASATTKPLAWQVGGFYYHARADLLGQNVLGTGVGGAGRGFSIVDYMKTNSYAVFGEVTYAITDTTHVTGGARYTHEKRTFTGFQVPINQVPGSALANAFTRPTTTDQTKFNKATFRAAIRQDLSDTVNVYGSYNRGFKSGIYSLNTVPGTNPPLKPQTIDAFELGVKSELFDNTLRLNVAGFHYKIKDFQIRSVNPAGGGTALLLNAASVKVDGAEADFEFAPTKELRLTGTATILNSRFASFPGNAAYLPNPSVCTPGVAPGGVITGPPTGGNRLCFGSSTGYRTPVSPKFAASLGINYTADVGNEGQAILSLLYSYTGKVFFEADNRLKQDSVSVFNGSLEYRPTPQWGVEVYAANIGDKRYYLTGAAGGTGDHGELAPPRTFGVNVKFDY